MRSSKTASSATESSSEGETEQVRKSHARRNYLRTHANPNMRNVGIYNGALLNQQYHQQLQQQYYRQTMMQQGYDNYAYTNCSYMPSPNYYGQYLTQSNCCYPQQQQQYLATPTKMPQAEYLSIRYVVPTAAPATVDPRYATRRDYAYYDYQNDAPIQTVTTGYNYTAYMNANQQQIVYQKNSTATTLNCDYKSRNSLNLNDMPTYELTHSQTPQLQHQQQQQQQAEQLKKVASENSLRFINIAAVGGSANMMGSNHSINKSGEYAPKNNVDLDRSNDLKGQINFLNFDKYERRPKCRTRLTVLIGLAVTIAVIVVLASVLGSVLPQKYSKTNQKAKTMINPVLITKNSSNETTNSSSLVTISPVLLNLTTTLATTTTTTVGTTNSSTTRSNTSTTTTTAATSTTSTTTIAATSTSTTTIATTSSSTLRARIINIDPKSTIASLPETTTTTTSSTTTTTTMSTKISTTSMTPSTSIETATTSSSTIESTTTQPTTITTRLTSLEKVFKPIERFIALKSGGGNIRGLIKSF